MSSLVKVVDDMRKLTQLSVDGSLIDVVILLGFHYKNDGGGGLFYFDNSRSSEQHNGGTIISRQKSFPTMWDGGNDWFTPPLNSDDGCWLRLIEEKRVNVLWFGAKDEKDTSDNNAIDSTIPINKAIQYTHSSSLHNLYIPSGKFIIDGTINAIDYKVKDKRLKINGDYMGHLQNVGTVLYRKENTNNINPILSIDTTNNGLINYGSVPFLEIANLTFVGDTFIEHSGIYIRTIGLNNPMFKNLHFEYIQGTPLHIFQNSPDARCEFMLIERMIVGVDWGTYDKNINKVRPNSILCNGIYLEGSNTSYDGIKIHKSQFHGNINSNSPALLIDVMGDILTIEDSQFHGSSNSVVTSIRELKMTGCYVEKTNKSAIKLLNNKNSIFRGNKTFNINHMLFSQLSEVLEIIDSEDDGSSTKGFIGSFYVLRDPNLLGTTLIKDLGVNSKINIGKYSSDFLSDKGSSSQSLRSYSNNILKFKIKNITGYRSHLNTYKTTEGINFTSNLGAFPEYTINLNTSQGLNNGLEINNRLSSSEKYTSLNIGAGGGFKFRTFSTAKGQSTAIFADYTGNVHIGKEEKATEKLEVSGNVKANAFLVAVNKKETTNIFENYFSESSKENNFKLKKLDDIETYLKNNYRMEGYSVAKHTNKGLIDISRQSINNEEKINELLLHIISLNKKIINLEKKNSELTLKFMKLEKRII